jgi:hypothetical protein
MTLSESFLWEDFRALHTSISNSWNRARSKAFPLADLMDQCKSIDFMMSTLPNKHFRFKAVANGALSCWIQNPVITRMSKLHYGAEVNAPYDAEIAEMRGRPSYRNERGDLRVESAWSSIVAKVRFVACITFVQSMTILQDAVVRSGEEFHQAYRVAWGDRVNFVHTSDLLIYRGETPPKFITDWGTFTPKISINLPEFLRRFIQAPPQLRGQMLSFDKLAYSVSCNRITYRNERSAVSRHSGTMFLPCA